MRIKQNTKMNEEWFPITTDEFRAYFSLCIIILQTPIFLEIMPRRRFLSIMNFLHFVDNEMVRKEDRIRKVRSVVDYLNTFRKMSS